MLEQNCYICIGTKLYSCYFQNILYCLGLKDCHFAAREKKRERINIFFYSNEALANSNIIINANSFAIRIVDAHNTQVTDFD